MQKPTKIQKFRSKKAAQLAAQDCQLSGWKAYASGNYVLASTQSGNETVTSYLHNDGNFHEYSRRAAI